MKLESQDEIPEVPSAPYEYTTEENVLSENTSSVVNTDYESVEKIEVTDIVPAQRPQPQPMKLPIPQYLDLSDKPQVSEPVIPPDPKPDIQPAHQPDISPAPHLRRSNSLSG